MTRRAQVLVVAIVLLLIGVVDFVQRIYVPRSTASRETQIGAVPLPGQPIPLASAQERLQSWFAASEQQLGDVPAQVASDPGSAGAAIPDRAELGGWRFVLRGIFDAGPTFAVLDVMQVSGGAVEQHRLSVGENLKGVRLEQISGRNISLSDGEKVIQLALFIDPKDNIASAEEEQ